MVVEHVVVVPRWKRHFNPMPRPALAPLKMKLFAIDLRSPSRTVSLRGKTVHALWLFEWISTW